MLTTCDLCGGAVDRYGVCAACGRHTPLTARERVKLLATGFEERDARLVGEDPLGFDGYPDALRKSREATGLREAVVCGTARVDRVACVLVCLDFRFFGGSMGVAVGEKVARAYDHATRQRLPLVAVTASGGARMQEGMASLVQMAKTAEARRRHAAAGLGQVTLATSPTTGGVYASFGSLADVILAEPGARMGFAGPRVVAELTGAEPPPDVHTAEFAFDAGLVDELVPRRNQVSVIGSLLRSFTAAPGPVTTAATRFARRARPAMNAGLSAWRRVGLARAHERPKGPTILDAWLVDWVELRGDRSGGGDDPAVVVRLGALGPRGPRVVAIAQDASAGGTGRIGAAGFRKAIRAIQLAGRLRLPVLSVIDTRGADPLAESEAAGVAAAIAETFVAMLGCPSPTLAVVTGEGGSGGALAMAPADRVLCWENAFFSVIAPEGAASILYRDGSRAEDLAERLGITADDLVRLGVVDRVVGEPAGGAQADPSAALASLGAAVAEELRGLRGAAERQRLALRARRWRSAAGAFTRDVSSG